MSAAASFRVRGFVFPLLLLGSIAASAHALPPAMDAEWASPHVWGVRLASRPMTVRLGGPSRQRLTVSVDRNLVKAAIHAGESGAALLVDMSATFDGTSTHIVDLMPTAPPDRVERYAIPGIPESHVQRFQVRFNPAIACPKRGTCRLTFDLLTRPKDNADPDDGRPRPRVAERAPMTLHASVTGPHTAMPLDVAIRTSGRSISFVTRNPRHWPVSGPAVEIPENPVVSPRPGPDTDVRGPLPAVLNTCSSNSDCATTCNHPTNCCAGQCQTSCAYAVNRQFLDELAASHRTRCRNHRCPAVACALDRTLWSAQCREGRCVAVKLGLF